MKEKSFGPAFGRTDLSWIFIFEPPDFFADFLAGFFRGFSRRICSPQFCGKKCPEKSSRKPRENPPKFIQQKSCNTFLQTGQGKKDGKDLSSQTRRGSPRRPSPRHPRPSDPVSLQRKWFQRWFSSWQIRSSKPEFAQPCLSRVKARSSPARRYKFGCVCSCMAGHEDAGVVTGHMGTNTPKFVAPR